MTSMRLVAPIIVGMLMALAPQRVVGAVFIVDDDAVECTDADFSTLGAAVAAAAMSPEADTILACAGTYPENLTIGAGNPLKIKGEGTGVTVLTGVAGSAGPVVDVTSGGRALLMDLTVDAGSALAGGTVYGIRYTDSHGRLSSVEVLNVRNGDGSSQGIGVRVECTGLGGAGCASLRVQDALIDNYTRAGLQANGPGASLIAVSNEIRSPAAPQVWAPNGIQISRGALGRLSLNTVQGPTSPNPPAGAGSGILVFCAGKTVVSANRVDDSDVGIGIADNQGAKVTVNRVSDSVFDAISLQFLGNFYGGSLGCPGHPVATSGNVIVANTAQTSGDSGISLVNYDPLTIATTPNENRLVANHVSGSAGSAIHVFASVGGDNPSANLLVANQLAGSGADDAVDESTGAGTAGTANTWRSNSCGTSSPAGLCQ